MKTRNKTVNKVTAVIKQYINTDPVRRRRNNVRKKIKSLFQLSMQQIGLLNPVMIEILKIVVKKMNLMV